MPEALALRDDTILTLAMVRPPTWDPVELSMTDQGAVVLADLLFDGLTQIGAEGGLEPGLASSWTVSDDGLVWTFDLDLDRTNVADVVAGLERLRFAASDSPAAQLLAEVDRIEPVNESSVRFVLHTPRAGLDWILSGLHTRSCRLTVRRRAPSRSRSRATPVCGCGRRRHPIGRLVPAEQSRWPGPATWPLPHSCSTTVRPTPRFSTTA